MQNADTIIIKKLIVSCIIGIFDYERKEKQNLIISLKLMTDTKKAGQSDDLNDTVNYHSLANKIHETTANSSFFLIEKLAEVIAALCLEENIITQVTVIIEKPKALLHAKSAAIEITRSK